MHANRCIFMVILAKSVPSYNVGFLGRFLAFLF